MNHHRLEACPAHPDDPTMSARTTEKEKIHLKVLAVCSPAVSLIELKGQKEFVKSNMPIILINRTTQQIPVFVFICFGFVLFSLFVHF